MNPLRIALPIASTAIACLFGFSCQSTPSTSSSSNWVVCDMPVDCADVADAVDCVDGYCVDSAGDRVEVEGSGGGSAGGSGGDSGGGSGGGAASGGASSSGGSAGSGGENLGGAGSATGGTGTGGAAAELTCDDFDQLATCDVAEDCTTGERMVDCCGTTGVTGVNVDQQASFDALAAVCNAAYPLCGCSPPLATVADDHRAVVGEVGVSCVEGVCKSHIAERPCGDALTCVAGEICVSSSTVLGPTETVEHTCVENPCSADQFDCTCAEPVCDQDDGHSRICYLSVDETADVLCQDQSQ